MKNKSIQWKVLMVALLLPLLSFAQLSVTQYSTATPFLLQPNRGQVCNNNNIQDKEVLYTASDEGMELFCYKDKLRLLLTTQPALVWINYPNQLGAMETENGKLRSKEIGKLKQDENYKSNTMIISNTRYYYYYEANPTISINL